MSSVDSRVVEMKFDASNFIRGITSTLSYVSKLKASLNFSEQEKSMEQLEKTANEMDFRELSNGVETVTAKFSMLNAIAVDAVVNIARTIESKLVSAIKGLSVDNVMAGWNKYAEKTTAVQTIMSATESTWQKDANKNAYVEVLKQTSEYSGFASDALESMAEMYEQVTSGALTAKQAQKQYNISAKEYEGIMTSLGEAAGFEGTQIEYVDEMIAKLNWFTDETSYKLTDMTSNIGTFTANGIALSDSVVAMEGISVWASKSGQGVNQAASAMYNLSQVMSNGVVRKEDWKSIQNANMATMEFKQTAIDTAVELGYLKETAKGVYETTAKTAKKGVAVTVESFDSNLTDTQWFTKDVLMGTLNEYGAFTQKLSDYMEDERFEMIDTTSEFLKMLDTYDAAEDKEQALADMAKRTGADIEDLRSVMVELSSEEYALGRSAFKAAQEAKTFQEAIDATKEAVATGWMNSFEIIFGNYEQAKLLWTDLANDLWDIFAGGAEARNDFLSELFNDLGGREVFLEIYANAMQGLKDIIQQVKDIFREVFPAKSAQTILIYMQRIRDLTKSFILFDEAGEYIGGKLNQFFSNTLRIGLNIIKDVIDTIKNVFGIFKLLRTVTKMVWANIAPSGEQQNILITFFGIIQKGTHFVAELSEKLRILFSKNMGNISQFVATSNALAVIKDILQALSNKVTATKEAFKGFFEELHKTKEESEGNRFERLSKVFEVLKNVMTGLWNVMKAIAPIFAKIAGAVGAALKVLGDGILEAVSTGNFDILSDLFSVGIIGGIYSLVKKLSEGVSVFTDLFGGVTESLEVMQAQVKAETIKDIAKAVLMLAGAALILSIIDSDKLLASVTAVAVLLAEMGGIMESMSMNTAANGSTKKGPFAALDNLSRGMQMSQMASAMIKLAGSVMILAVAMKLIASIKEEDLLRSTAAVSALLGELTGAMVVISKYGGKDGGAAALIGMGVAVMLIAGALKKLGEMEGLDLFAGLAAITFLITELTTALVIMSKYGARGGFTMMLAATGLVIMAGALKILATIKLVDLAKGILAIAGMLIVLAIGCTAMLAALPGAAALVIASVGLIALAAAMKIMATIKFSSLMKGVIVIAALLGVLAIGLTAMLLAAPGAVALGLFAVALTMLLGPLAILGRMKWKTILSALAKLVVVVLAIAAASLLLLPASIAVFLFGVALGVCAIGITAIATSFTLLALALTMLTAVGKSAITTLLSMIKSFLKGLVDLVPILFNIVKKILVGLKDVLPDFFDFVIELVNGICDTAVTLFPKIINTAFDLVTTLITTIGERAPELAEVGISSFLSIVNGISDSVETHKKDIKDAVYKFCRALVDLLMEFFGVDTDSEEYISSTMWEKGWMLVKSILEGLWGAIKDLGNELYNAGKDIGTKIADGLKDAFDALPEWIKAIIQVPIQGVKSTVGIVKDSFWAISHPDQALGSWWYGLTGPGSMGDALGQGLDIFDWFPDAKEQPKWEKNKGVVINTGYVKPVYDLDNYSSLGGKASIILSGNAANTSGLDSTSLDKSTLKTAVTNNYSFNQYNTSPTELNTTTIYRNTKSQFALMRSAVTGQ